MRKMIGLVMLCMMIGCVNYEKTPMYCKVHEPDRCLVLDKGGFWSSQIGPDNDHHGFFVRRNNEFVFQYNGTYSCSFDKESIGIVSSDICVPFRDIEGK